MNDAERQRSIANLQAFEDWCRKGMRSARRITGPSPRQLRAYDRWMNRWIGEAEAARADLADGTDR